MATSGETRVSTGCHGDTGERARTLRVVESSTQTWSRIVAVDMGEGDRKADRGATSSAEANTAYQAVFENGSILPPLGRQSKVKRQGGKRQPCTNSHSDYLFTIISFIPEQPQQIIRAPPTGIPCGAQLMSPPGRLHSRRQTK